MPDGPPTVLTPSCTQGARNRTSTPGAADKLGRSRVAANSNELPSCLRVESKLVQASEIGSSDRLPNKQPLERPTSTQKGLGQLAFCFLGLQLSYLTWGYMQEKVMTKEYGVGHSASKFPSASFCVFSNRVLAILMAAAIMLFRKGRLEIMAPLTAFAPCSLTNTISSTAQYMALRHVSFPLQTLTKSVKVVLVMLMGKVLNSKSYPWKDYLEALIISAGVYLFATSSGTAKTMSGDSNPTTGVFLLALYLASDSFTSQYQSRVYKKHPQVDQYQMMFATNLWSIFFTTLELVHSGGLSVSLAFFAEHPEAIVDNVLIALTSATGQIFIFHTIKNFGPVVFTVMMTTRQVFSIVISSTAFNHNLPPTAWLGAALVFGAAFYRIKPKSK